MLADDNFATIVVAVREGRRIFDAIFKFVMHLLSGNMAEAVVLMLSLLWGLWFDQLVAALLYWRDRRAAAQ